MRETNLAGAESTEPYFNAYGRWGWVKAATRLNPALELEAQRKLNVALVTLRGRFPERGAGRIEIRTVPVRVVEGVECLGAELEALRFGHGELLVQTDVPILEAGIVNGLPETNCFTGVLVPSIRDRIDALTL